MAVTVALTYNFTLEKEWSIIFGSKSEAPKPELSPNYVAAAREPIRIY